MGKLLCFGATELLEARLGNHLAERFRDGFLAESDRDVQVVGVVRHRGVAVLGERAGGVHAVLQQIDGDVVGKALPGEHGAQLPHAIAAEVEAEGNVLARPLPHLFVGGEVRHELAVHARVVTDAMRLDELVVEAFAVRVGDDVERRLHRWCVGPQHLVADNGVECLVGAVPAFVAIHRIVAPADCADLAFAFDGEPFVAIDALHARARWRVAPVGEHVDDRFDLVKVAQVDEFVEMVDVRVHATIR